MSNFSFIMSLGEISKSSLCSSVDIFSNLFLKISTGSFLIFLDRLSDSKTARILEYCNQLANPIYFFYNIKDMNKTNIQYKNKNKLFVA